MDLWFTSWHLVWSFYCLTARMRTADGSEVSPDYRRSSSGRQSHAFLVPTISQKKCHAHPDARFSWWKPQIAKIEASMRATLNDVVHVQRTACWRCCPLSCQQVGLLFFHEEIDFVETKNRVVADLNHIDRELKKRRHPHSLYSLCTRRIVENEASACRNWLAFVREKRIICLSVGVKLYL